jgi:hypothetical protein
MNKLHSVLLLLLSLMAIDCKKMNPTTVPILTEEEKRFNDIKAQLDNFIPIVDSKSDYYCEGKLDNKFFRFSYTGNYNFPYKGDDDYYFRHDFSLGNKKDTADYITFQLLKEKDWENRGATNENPRYRYAFRILVPLLFTNNINKIFEDNNYFIKGKSFKFTNSPNGIDGVSIDFSYIFKDRLFFAESNIIPNAQNSNNYCILDDITKKETATQYIYDMTFKFDVRLYVNVGDLGILNPKYLTSITDGVFRTRYIIEK